MPTFGFTTEPADGAEWGGSGVDNQHAIPLTMPVDGTITTIGVIIRGKDASCSFKGVVWNSTRNTVLGQTATQTATGAAFAIGAGLTYEAAVVTPFDVAGGTSLYVGFCRNPTGAMQFSWDSSSSHYDDDNGSSNPSAMSGETLHSTRRFSAFCGYIVGPEVYVRRSSAWVKADNGIFTSRSGAWSADVGQEIYVYRGGVWVKAT